VGVQREIQKDERGENCVIFVKGISKGTNKRRIGKDDIIV